MAAPTQEYPPWLSLSATILTNDQGVPTATAETVLRLPLTYYGPPPEIPLGTDGAWVYGGLTSPAPVTSTTSNAATTTTPTPTTTTATTPAIPSSSTSPSASAASTSTQSSSATSSSSSSSSSIPSSSSSSLPSSSSASPSSTTTAAAAGSSSHSNLGRILGLALGITGGLVLLFILIALCVFCRRRRARRRGGVSPTGDALWQWHPIDTDEAHEHDAAREPGEGSPRGSGEEHDPFLRPSTVAATAATAGGVAAAESFPREKDESTPPRLVGPSQRNASSTSAGLPFASGLLSWGRRNKAHKLEADEKSGSEQYFDAETGQLASPVAGNGNNGSGGGANRRSVVFANIPPTPPRSSTPARDRHIIPRDVLMRMYPDSRPATPRSRPATPRSPRSPPPLGMNSPQPPSAFEDDSDDYDNVGVPLLPPRLIPSRSRSNYSMRTGRSSRSMGSEHEATVHTARRVRLDEHAMARALPTERYDDDVEAMAQRSWARRVGLHTDAFRDLVDNHGWLRSLVGRGSGRGSVPPSPMPSLDSRASHHGAWTGSDSPPLMPYRSRSHSRSRPNSYAGGVLAAIPDSDVSSSHGHNLDPVREARLSPAPPRLREMGLMKPAMTRPVSGATVGSAKSSDTVFYDAPSRFGTPVQGGTMSSGGSRTVADIPPVPPLPTATTAPLRIRSRDGMRPRGGSEPPAYESLQMPASTYSPTFHTPIDDLNDEPPRPVSPFATASTATAHSRPTIPSSLAMPTVAAWNRSGSNSPSPRDSGMGSQELITIDVLEEAPPEAGVNWNLLRRTEDPNARRATFGGAGPATILTTSRDNVHASLEPSLHSASPTGQFLTAHTPRDGSGSHSSGSASTRAHSHDHEQSGSSGQTGSVSSHGHRLNAASPPLSAVGHRHRISDISSRMNSRPTSANPAPHPVPNASVGSSVTTHQSVRDARTGEILRFPFVPSTAGLSTTREDEGERLRGGDGSLDDGEESVGWGGSWGGPEHLRMLQSSGSGASM